MSDMLDSPGTRVGNETNTFIPADAPIRCLRDQIILEPLDWQPSKIILISGYQGKPLRGIVRAVGPGCYRIEYQDAVTGHWGFSVPKGRRKAMRPSKVFRPCDVKVGDTVELGGLEIGGYLHQTFMWGHKECVICREEDVAGVCTPDTTWAPACETFGCDNYAESSEKLCTDCLDKQRPPLIGLDGKPLPKERFYDASFKPQKQGNASTTAA